ncbi:ABC transporter permease [Gryllotalpicola ginsengisoli]|uniref:ABC transporter permease n=1 Tax=Gryllotalpicola ginsengisoli TaxID=444608 RepID=UPI00040CAD4E|nr:ABC transporter permease [Gryllotalpicola ginsengisoli]
MSNIPPIDPQSNEAATSVEVVENLEQAPSAIELKEVEGLSQGRIVLRRFLRHRGAMISSGVLIFVILLAYSAQGLHLPGIDTPGWWPYKFTDTGNVINGGVPSWKHPFGQDSLGRDMFAIVMRGCQQSLMIVAVVGIISTFIGVVVGALSGYFRGWIDTLLMRLTDVVIIIPLIVLTATLGRKYGASGALALALVLGLASWTGLARLVRGDVLGLREREFVDAARVAGASPWRIMFVHILPNAIGVIIVNSTLLMSATILVEAAISFLNFGVQLPDVSLGSVIGTYQAAFATRPWLFFWPAGFIVIIALTINFIGDGLRDAFDPRQKRQLNKAARRSAAAAREKAASAARAEKAATAQ